MKKFSFCFVSFLLVLNINAQNNSKGTYDIKIIHENLKVKSMGKCLLKVVSEGYGSSKIHGYRLVNFEEEVLLPGYEIVKNSCSIQGYAFARKIEKEYKGWTGDIIREYGSLVIVDSNGNILYKFPKKLSKQIMVYTNFKGYSDEIEYNYSFVGDKAVLTKSGLWGSINTQGVVVVPFKYLHLRISIDGEYFLVFQRKSIKYREGNVLLIKINRDSSSEQGEVIKIWKDRTWEDFKRKKVIEGVILLREWEDSEYLYGAEKNNSRMVAHVLKQDGYLADVYDGDIGPPLIDINGNIIIGKHEVDYKINYFGNKTFGYHDKSKERAYNIIKVFNHKNLSKISKENKNSIAVIIGNKNYDHNDVPNVGVASNDSRQVQDLLINNLGYKKDNIIYTENATKGELESIFGSKYHEGKLQRLIKSKEDDSPSNIFIYYSGHGVPNLNNIDEVGLAPTDFDPRYFSTVYPLHEFYNHLRALDYKNLYVVLDACFSGNSASGMLFRNISPPYISNRAIEFNSKNAVIFTSTSSGEISSWYKSKNHSLFTYYFLEGIKSKKADLNNDNNIKTEELFKYVKSNVEIKANNLFNRNQNPMLQKNDSYNPVIVNYADYQ